MGGVVFGRGSAKRIAAAVRKVEGGQGTGGVNWYPYRGRDELIQVFKVGGVPSCGVVMGQPAYWQECDLEQGDKTDCAWKIKTNDAADPVPLWDRTQAYYIAYGAHKLSGSKYPFAPEYVEARFVSGLTAKGDPGGFWQIVNVLFCDGCPADNCDKPEISESSSSSDSLSGSSSGSDSYSGSGSDSGPGGSGSWSWSDSGSGSWSWSDSGSGSWSDSGSGSWSDSGSGGPSDSPSSSQSTSSPEDELVCMDVVTKVECNEEGGLTVETHKIVLLRSEIDPAEGCKPFPDPNPPAW